MCGIFGYVGTKSDAANLVLEGLKLLEYRGYDSWGIAVKVKSEAQTQEATKGGQKLEIKSSLEVEKHIGKIGNASVHLPSSSIGIGHTRWATHGGVTRENAHPHLDCRKQLAVIHNGIVENHGELKKDLMKKGHTFISETDTETIVHLIEENLKKQGFASAVKDAFNKLQGLNAIVVLNAVSKEIVAAKTGSPLVVGQDKNGFYVASDVSGIVKHTRRVIFLEDNQLVILGKKLKLIRLPKGEEIEPDFQTIDWTFEQVEKGKFKHFLIKEIHEQPRIIENIALNYTHEAQKLAMLIDKAFGTFMLGCGTASYAALSGVYLFSRIAKKHVNFSIGSEFNYLEDYLTSQSLLIPISQSGETIDVVESVQKAKQKGAHIAAIVNVLGATLYRQAHDKILLGAGPEKAVIGTKSFIAMISILLLTACVLARRHAEGKKMLLDASNGIKDILKKSFLKKIQSVADDLKKKEHIFVIGRGLSYATALEMTLKIKETSYIHAEGFAGGELKHGVIALIEEGTPCIVVASKDETYDDIISNAAEIRARGGYIIGIGPKENSVFDRFLKTTDAQDATIIPQVVISQLLAYYLALKRGIKDPDKPRNLAKSVTVK